MALTEQTLPNIENLACGTVGVRMYYDDTITGLTFPTTVKFLDIGKFTESVDKEAGVIDLENVDITVAEDYSTHAEGFWYKLISENPDKNIELLFTLVEGSDETFLFKGNIYRENIKVPEYYLNALSGTPTDWVRGMKFKLVSSVNVLKDVGIADLCTEIETHAVTGTVHSGTATEYTMVTFRSVIASMIKLAYGEAYDEDLVVANATDIQVYDEFDTAWISPLDAYLPVNYFTSTPGPNFVYLTMCSNAYEVLKHICNQFALIPRYTFGTTAEIISGTPANNKSRLTFDSRGRTGVLVTMPSKFVESDLLMDTPRKGRNIRVYETFTPDNGYYFYNNQEHSGQPPSYMEFDITKTVDHELHNGGLFAYGYLYTFDSGASEWYHLETGRYWDYSTGAYVEVDQATDYGFAGALAGYMFNRFSDGRFGYTRNYAGLKATYSATDSQRWLRSLCRHALHDGVTNRTFYATEVSKDIKENKASVVWLEE